MCPGQLHGCKRGVYGLDSWEPLRQPRDQSGASTGPPQTPQEMAPQKNGAGDGPTKRRPMIGKYSYRINAVSPLGKELPVAMQQRFTFIEYHAENASWMLAENDDGDIGYVPTSYMQFDDEKRQTSLPWLQNKEPEPEEKPAEAGTNVFGAPDKPKFKAYQSTYVHKELEGLGGGSKPVKEFYCEICEKQLNGIKPYQAHMVSKAHREEVAFRNGES